MNRPKFLLATFALVFGLAFLYWAGSLDGMSDQQRIDRVNAAYRPIHGQLDKRIASATTFADD